MAKKTTHTPKGKKTDSRSTVKKEVSKSKKKPGDNKKTKSKPKPKRMTEEKYVDAYAKHRDITEKIDKKMRKWLGTTDAPQEDPSVDQAVGYGNPPRHSQFKPGVSGNPKGRPKGSKNVATIVHEIGSMSVKFKQGDQDKEMPMIEALIYKSFLRAINEGKLDNMIFLTEKYDRSVTDIKERKRLEDQKFMDRRMLLDHYLNNM